MTNSQSTLCCLTLLCYWWRRSWRATVRIELVWTQAETDEDCLRGRWQSSAAPSSSELQKNTEEEKFIFTTLEPTFPMMQHGRQTHSRQTYLRRKQVKETQVDSLFVRRVTFCSAELFLTIDSFCCCYTERDSQVTERQTGQRERDRQVKERETGRSERDKSYPLFHLGAAG